MQSFKTETYSKQVVEEVICDSCGSKIMKDKHGYFYDYVHVEKTWGYNSSKDGQEDTLDICEKCFDEIKEKNNDNKI